MAREFGNLCSKRCQRSADGCQHNADGNHENLFVRVQHWRCAKTLNQRCCGRDNPNCLHYTCLLHNAYNKSVFHAGCFQCFSHRKRLLLKITLINGRQNWKFPALLTLRPTWVRVSELSRVNLAFKKKLQSTWQTIRKVLALAVVSLCFCIRLVAQQEHQLAKELAENLDLVREMHGKLHKACRALDKALM